MKNKNSILAIAISMAFSTSALAAADVSTELGIGFGVVKNGDGGMGLDSYGGISSAENRLNGDLDLATVLSYPGYDLQFGLAASTFEDASQKADQDDATGHFEEISAHYLRKVGNYRIGGFVGWGSHDDNGDSDDSMGYRFLGIEADRPITNGNVFGQIGYLDSYDEYNEGTQDAPFVRVGANYSASAMWRFSGSIAYAGGVKLGANYDNSTWAIELGAERKFNDMITGFVSYELDRIGFENDESEKLGDVFHTVMVGIKMSFGDKAKFTKPISLPSFGRWVAFNANEIE